MLCLLFAATLGLVPAQSQADTLQNFRAVYRVEKFNSDIGRATYQLLQEGGEAHFFMRSELSGFFALFRNDRVEEDSWLKQTDKGLQLQGYSYKHTGSKRNRDTVLKIQWSEDHSSGTASGTHAGKKISHKIAANVHDVLSFQLALMQDAAQQDSKLDYQVLSKNELKQYTFQRAGKETLELANHYIDTVIVERRQSDRTIRLWLASELQYVPVKIELIEDDDSATRMFIDSLTLGVKQVL